MWWMITRQRFWVLRGRLRRLDLVIIVFGYLAHGYIVLFCELDSLKIQAIQLGTIQPQTEGDYSQAIKLQNISNIAVNKEPHSSTNKAIQLVGYFSLLKRLDSLKIQAIQPGTIQPHIEGDYSRQYKSSVYCYKNIKCDCFLLAPRTELNTASRSVIRPSLPPSLHHFNLLSSAQPS